jgi:hypothetical protein
VVQIWPGQTVTCLHTNSPGHIWTTLYILCDLCGTPGIYTVEHPEDGHTSDGKM